MQVLHVNMHRIYDLWGIFLSHVLEVRSPLQLREYITAFQRSLLAPHLHFPDQANLNKRTQTRFS